MPDDPPPEDDGAAPVPLGVRCETCRSIVSTRHAWDSVTCACGSLTVSGRPTKPRVSWIARPGGGWSRQVDDDAAEDPEDPAAASRPIGFLP